MEGWKYMSNGIVVDGVQYTEEQCNTLIYDFFSPIVLEQKPFLRDDMTVGEYLKELKYYGENFDKVLNRTYEPLWKQKEGNYTCND